MMESLEEFKQAAHPFIKDLSEAELIENLKASCYQCSIEIARTGGKLNVVKSRVWPIVSDKTEFEFLESYLAMLLNWKKNAQNWLEELQGEKERAA